MTNTALIWDERTMWHDSGARFGPRSPWIEPARHLENVDTKRRIKSLLDASCLTDHLLVLPPSPASRAQLLRVHHAAYVDRIAEISAAGGGNIADVSMTHIGEGGFEIASIAAGATSSAIDAIMAGDIRNAYALIRPPGHHAEAAAGKGFCVFNNGAIAAAHALETAGAERVAIIDFDAHHGNGAQSLFWNDPRVLCISLHQDRAFPQSIGDVDEQGEGDGLGFNINVPLPPASSEAAYLDAFDQIVRPALDMFGPDLIIVACGVDAGFMDPTARMMLSSDSFRAITSFILQAADALCDGRVVFTHEGGYEIFTVPFHVLAILETLADHRTEVVDPFLPAISQTCAKPTTSQQTEAIARAKAAMMAHPPRTKS